MTQPVSADQHGLEGIIQLSGLSRLHYIDACLELIAGVFNWILHTESLIGNKFQHS